jgi:dinuclear metal center YbgI/SA1388 family protein
MPTVEEIYRYLQTLAPLDLQMSFDNSGMLLGDAECRVSRVLLALDVTDEVVKEAADCGAQLILSHHPLIFHPIRNLSCGPETEKLYALIRSGIAVLSFHTNLDIADGGVNDVLIRLLGTEPMEALDESGCGRIGEYTEPWSFPTFLRMCKDKLQTSGLRWFDAEKKVRRLAVMGGSGGSAIRDAWQKGCDTYVTADLKYHDFLLAQELGLNLVDGDHFCTENPVMFLLQAKLQKAFPDTEVMISKRHHQIIQFA